MCTLLLTSEMRSTLFSLERQAITERYKYKAYIINLLPTQSVHFHVEHYNVLVDSHKN